MSIPVEPPAVVEHLAPAAPDDASSEQPEPVGGQQATKGETNPTTQRVEEVQVTGTGSEADVWGSGVDVDVLTEEALRNLGGGDLADALERVPGLGVNRDAFGAGLQLRGFEGAQILVLVDGKRWIGAKDGVIDLSRLPLEDIVRIEVVKGPASALYGSDAIGGVIHIFTRKGTQSTQLRAGLRAGSQQTVQGNLSFTGTAGRFDHAITALAQHTGGYDLDPTDLATTGSAMTTYRLADRSGLTLDDGTRIELNASAQVRDVQGVDTGAGGVVIDRRNLQEEGSVGIHVDHPLTKGKITSQATLTGFRDQFLFDQRNASALDEVEDTRETLAEIRTQLDHNLTRHRLSMGVDGAPQRLTNPRIAQDGERVRGAVFLQDTFIADPGTLMLGIRGETDSTYGNAISPRGSLAMASEHVTVRTGMGAGYRAPAFKELLLSFENPGAGYRVTGQPDLEPERSVTLDAGVSFRDDSSFELSVSAHHSEITNLITTTTATRATGQLDEFSYANVGTAMIRGTDVSVSWSPGLWTTEGTVALLDTRDRDLDLPLEGRPNLRVGGQVGVNPGSASLSLRVQHTGKKPFADPGNEGEQIYAAANTLLDVQAGFRFSQDWRCSAQLRNLLDQQDPTFPAAPPRGVFFELRGLLYNKQPQAPEVQG